MLLDDYGNQYVDVFCGVRMKLDDAVRAANKHLVPPDEEPLDVYHADFVGESDNIGEMKHGLTVKVDTTNLESGRRHPKVDDMFGFVGFDVADDEGPSMLSQAGQCVTAYTRVCKGSRFRERTQALDDLFGAGSWSLYVVSSRW
uniref:Uncharacterized protein n=1 Tax=Marseillevirus LCMAC103 TaxID=2506604 RepID=A0A481YWX4_9VIRU|nr:MAG: hypothetical protein LCMAC103_03700 [Marseillevirus LCMAC103]